MLAGCSRRRSAWTTPISQRLARLGPDAVAGLAGGRSPGATWQERWLACGADGPAADWRDLVAGLARRHRPDLPANRRPPALGGGLVLLICADVIRPGLRWLLRTRPARAAWPPRWPGPATPPGSPRCGRCATGRAARATARRPRCDRIAVHPGRQGRHGRRHHRRRLPGAAGRSRAARIGTGPRQQRRSSTSCCTRWASSRPDAPRHRPDVRQPAASSPPSELIDRTSIACRPVRDLLVDYLRERQPRWTTRRCEHWPPSWPAVLERPGGPQPGHRLAAPAPEVAAAWKQRLRPRPTGAARRAGSPRPQRRRTACLLTVRAFYLDIAQWAADDPARWGPWAAPCPIRAERDPHAKKTAPHASPGWTSGPANGCPSCPPSPPPPSSRAKPRAAQLLAAARQPGPARRSPPPGRRCAGRS